MTTSPESYSPLAAEAMLGAWEAILEGRIANNKGLPEGMADAWDDLGTVHMRFAAMAVGQGIADIYSALPEDLQEAASPYDWEFIPTVIRMSKFINEAIVLPDSATVTAHFAKTEADRAEASKEAFFGDWLRLTKHYSVTRYAYDQTEGLTEDEIRKIYADDEWRNDYQIWVDWRAEKDGLEPVTFGKRI